MLTSFILFTKLNKHIYCIIHWTRHSKKWRQHFFEFRLEYKEQYVFIYSRFVFRFCFLFQDSFLESVFRCSLPNQLFHSSHLAEFVVVSYAMCVCKRFITTFIAGSQHRLLTSLSTHKSLNVVNHLSVWSVRAWFGHRRTMPSPQSLIKIITENIFIEWNEY